MCLLLTTRYQLQRFPVPGSGAKIDFLGDTFEEDGWKFYHNHPKSSREEDGQARGAVGLFRK